MAPRSRSASSAASSAPPGAVERRAGWRSSTLRKPCWSLAVGGACARRRGAGPAVSLKRELRCRRSVRRNAASSASSGTRRVGARRCGAWPAASARAERRRPDVLERRAPGRPRGRTSTDDRQVPARSRSCHRSAAPAELDRHDRQRGARAASRSTACSTTARGCRPVPHRTTSSGSAARGTSSSSAAGGGGHSSGPTRSAYGSDRAVRRCSRHGPSQRGVARAGRRRRRRPARVKRARSAGSPDARRGRVLRRD